MNTPNPLVPQGSFPSRGKSTVRIAFFTIAALHIVFIGGLLMQGCKKPEEKPVTQEVAPDPLPPMPDPSTNLPPTNVATTIPTNVAPEPTGTVAPDPLPFAAPDAKEYIVARGDNFSTIAKRNQVSIKAIEQANPGVNSTKLKVGQKLQIPASNATRDPANSPAPPSNDNGETKTYVVRAGDMLEKIANRHGTTAKTIMRLNNLKTTMIKPGQKLKLPTKSASAESPASPGYVTPLPATK